MSDWSKAASVPIQAAEGRLVDRRVAEEAYKEYVARYGSAQSFNEIHDRGGFGAVELAVLLYRRIKKLEIE